MNDPKTTTLFGGKEINVVHDGGKTGTLTVRQFKLVEYPRLLPLLDNEMELCAAACMNGDSRSSSLRDIQSLTPESYEAVYAAVREVNAKGFFTWSARQLQKGNEAIANWAQAGIPMEKIAEMMRAMTGAVGEPPTAAGRRPALSTSPIMSAILPPPAG